MQPRLCELIHLSTILNARSFDHWVQYLAHVDGCMSYCLALLTQHPLFKIPLYQFIDIFYICDRLLQISQIFNHISYLFVCTIERF